MWDVCVKEERERKREVEKEKERKSHKSSRLCESHGSVYWAGRENQSVGEYHC